MTSIERLDPSDDSRFAEFHRVYAAAHDGEWDRPFGLRELRVELADDSEFTHHVSLLARNGDGVAVGVGSIEFPLKDNRVMAYLEIWVALEFRRAGHGSALVDALADVAREHGRTTLFAEARWNQGESQRGNCAFAEARGFHLDLVDAHRVLFLPAPRRVAPPRDGYELHSWRGPCPVAWIEQYARLLSLITQEAPSGDLALENEFFDAARVRADEDLRARQGRQMQVSIALSPAGEVAGHTQLVFGEASPDDAFQWDTLVLRQHRGHGLGLSLKVHTMTAAQDLLDGRSYIHTYNAVSNAPMIAVNEFLGYRHVANSGEYVRGV